MAPIVNHASKNDTDKTSHERPVRYTCGAERSHDPGWHTLPSVAKLDVFVARSFTLRPVKCGCPEWDGRATGVSSLRSRTAMRVPLVNASPSFVENRSLRTSVVGKLRR